MAISLNAATTSGSVLASDTVGGEELQKIRVTGGGTSETAAYSASNPFPVYLAGAHSLTLTFVVSGTIEVGGDVSLTGSFSVLLSGPVSLTGSIQITGTTNPIEVVGDAAHDAAVAGNPVLQGFEARTTNPTAVADGDAVRAMADDMGRQVVQPFAPRDRVVTNHVSLSVSTTLTLLAAGGAGVFRDLVMLTISNPSASAATVTIFDGLTAGAQTFAWEFAADGGGIALTFSVPFPQASANNGWGIKSTETGVKATAQAIDTV